MKHAFISFLVVIFLFGTSLAQSAGTRIASGEVITDRMELLPNATIEIVSISGLSTTVTDAAGRFRLEIPEGEITIRIAGRNFATFERKIGSAEATQNLQLQVRLVAPPISESVVIAATELEPSVELRNDAVYKNSLFGRDDQLIFTLNAGINAGQHEGGGKSLEIRRFGFNTDHGGVNGGLKILVDNVPQNQGTQGHGQGYLGSLKSLSPELVKDVSIINGPFSAAYGDFSGLGVVQISLKETLPHKVTARFQGGTHKTFRGFFAYSPKWRNIDAFVAYEPSYTDGPFNDPLRYRRDNVSGNLTRTLGGGQAIGFKFNFGRNDFFSSGQIPLDLVATGDLDRFGAIDPENGGKIRLGTAAGYYRKEWDSGATLKADAFVGRSLFDMFSNFTFFLADPVYGDEIQQHDSRLQEGGNVQYLRPYGFFGSTSLLTIGGGVHLNQINVGLYPSMGRVPNRKFLAGNFDNASVFFTQAHARVNNSSGYIQNTFAFFDGHLRLDAGLRFDRFDFDVKGLELGRLNEENPSRMDCSVSSLRSCGDILKGRSGEGRLQPKIAAAWSPFNSIPVTFYANYGRGISSQDARGVARDPQAPRVSTTDFFQIGTSFNSRQFSIVLSSFLIDRSHEQVYIPDDGSIEFAGRSRSYGLELRNSIRLNRFVSFSGGLTQVLNAFYPGEFGPDGKRLIVDSAPHTVANGGLVFNELRGFTFSLNWRHISNYRLDADDPTIKASGHDVVDLHITKRLGKRIDLNLVIDNILNKKYYETQNFFESRTGPNAVPISRIHATPGYPITFTVGLTLRLGEK